MTSFRTASLALALGVLMTAMPAAAADHPLFAFIYRPGPAWKPALPMAQQDLRPHATYIAKLSAEGRVVAAGGWSGLDGGMAVLRAADEGEAARLLAADPAITSGIFLADLRRWAPRYGIDTDLVPPRPAARPMPQP